MPRIKNIANQIKSSVENLTNWLDDMEDRISRLEEKVEKLGHPIKANEILIKSNIWLDNMRYLEHYEKTNLWVMGKEEKKELYTKGMTKFQ